ncbi:frataxin homolog, mitochondrial [Leptopilina heterotoma]|uniref:frataxin homolog, mitochondrial n=1 Tax=Leptopilina heterotoma TaxID=63436 RepID=UPI001CA86012|nr:frataxin homolog, mitochondrial [Leptopilina heterotoma]
MLGTAVKIFNFNKLFVDLTARFVGRKLKNNTRLLHSFYFRGYATLCSNKYFKYLDNNKAVIYFTVHRKYSTDIENKNSQQEISATEYDKVSNETLESLTEFFDEIVDQAEHLEDADVSYGDGVLTVKFGGSYGTYVLNRQTPNKQIWLSSPTSGPKRYDFINNKWIYKHDGNSLHELLNSEIPSIVKQSISFNKCSYSGK